MTEARDLQAEIYQAILDESLAKASDVEAHDPETPHDAEGAAGEDRTDGDGGAR